MSVFVCWSRGGDLGGLVGGDLDGEAPVLDVVDDVAGSVACPFVAAPGLPGGRGGGLEAKGAPWPRTGLYRGYMQLVHSGSGRPRGRYPRYLALGVLNRLEAPV